MKEPAGTPKPGNVNVPVSLEPRDGDIDLTPAELAQLSLFQLIKSANKRPKFDNFPGSTRIRHYRLNDEIWRQGEVGHSAFYILTAKDVETLENSHPEFRGQWDRQLSGSTSVEVASVQLGVANAPPEPQRRSWWSRLFGRRTGPAVLQSEPASINFDGPANIDYTSRSASMYEGELFGEASCLEGRPRSATVIAQRNWYVLEMTRNILTPFQKDEGYKNYRDDLYKKRGLGLHLRNFSFLADLQDGEFNVILEHVRAAIGNDERSTPGSDIGFATRKHGEVLWHQHETADCLYIVRNGLIQVVSGISPLLGPDDVKDWTGLCGALCKPGTPGYLGAEVSVRIARVNSRIRQPLPQIDPEVLDALNEVICATDFAADPSCLAGLTHPSCDLAQEVGSRKENPRRFHRLLLEALYPGLIRVRDWDKGVVLAYRSRGSFIGEGSLGRRRRMATCIAFLHPDVRDLMDVELFRISSRILKQMVDVNPRLRERFAQEIDARVRETEAILTGSPRKPGVAALQSPAFEALGLAQGQKLMLIDLDRCTRCGECVRACRETHSDGNTRLYLEGPRFLMGEGKNKRDFLAPLTCRSCRDPVCMMKCPVGSIHRGSKGQMVIEEWCIGCERCALDCPYDSIQMKNIGLIPESADDWRYAAASDIRDPSWYQPAFSARRWPETSAPFFLDHECDSRIRKPFPETRSLVPAQEHPSEQTETFFFRRNFDLPPTVETSEVWLWLCVTSCSNDVQVWLNGEKILAQLQPDPKKTQSKGVPVREGPFRADRLRHKGNLLAVSVTSPVTEQGMLLDLGVYKVQEVAGGDEESHMVSKIVSRRAVVCDLCAKHSSGPACVNACPHAATERFDARDGITPW